MISPFRKSAMEKMASPEQLDEMMQVTNPKEWIVLAAFLLLTITELEYSSLPKYFSASLILFSNKTFDF